MLDRLRSAGTALILRLKAMDAAIAGWVAAHPRLTMSLAALVVAGAVML